MGGLKSFIDRLAPIADVLLAPLVYPCAWLLKNIRRAGVHKLPLCRDALLRVGVFPVRNHYYEPQFDHREPRRPFFEDRALPGIDWNVDGQLALLAKLPFAHEIAELPRRKSGVLEFHLGNEIFESGDAEVWYQMIRWLKPRRIFEIGSGASTLMALRALRRNREEDPRYGCRHVCIEPYEAPWLEQAGVEVVRRKVEELGVDFFAELGENDILFIDSSHVIRPQGDVLFEYLQLLPALRKGVIVHVHDVFSPRDYPAQWLEEQVLFWNEQYLLEAFLSHNRSWKIIGALNYLHHNHYEKLRAVAPCLTPDREPGSFYLQKL
jgi:predicted O-methyltransferase YrrM